MPPTCATKDGLEMVGSMLETRGTFTTSYVIGAAAVIGVSAFACGYYFDKFR